MVGKGKMSAKTPIGRFAKARSVMPDMRVSAGTYHIFVMPGRRCIIECGMWSVECGMMSL